MISFADLKLYSIERSKVAEITPEISIDVKTYLSVRERIDFIRFVITNSLDVQTGCFSPMLVEVFYSLGAAKWYGGITYTDEELEDPGFLYDALETNGVIDKIFAVIPQDEQDFMNKLVLETVADVARYNNSFAGLLNSASSQSDDLNAQINEILKNIQNREGLEVLSGLTSVVGKD